MTVKGANQDGERARGGGGIDKFITSWRLRWVDDARDYRIQRVVKLSGGGVKCGEMEAQVDQIFSF